MDWSQTATIIVTLGGGIIWGYRLIKEDIQLIREDIKRHDAELAEIRKEFSANRQEDDKRNTMWAALLKEIQEIKLHQARKK